MESTITPKEIEQMKAFLKEHPVDPQYDGLLDGDIPTEQAHAHTSTTMHTHRGFFMPIFRRTQ